MNAEPGAALAAVFSEEARRQVSQYVDLLLDAGVERGLIGPREASRVWDRHILNSVAALDLIPTCSTLVDVGSGAGLPGVPVAIARPDLKVTLLEPLLRRATFLGEVVEALDLAERVSVVRARAEDHGRTYDVVLARAVAPLDRLVAWCRPLLRPGGVLLALKGQSAEKELRAAAGVLRAARLQADVLEVRAFPGAEPTWVVRVC